MDLDTGACEAGVARSRFGGVLLAGLSLRINVGQHVMDDATVARLVLDPRDVHVLGQACRHHEAAVDVSTRGRDLEIGPDIQDQIGAPFQGPVLRELTGARQVGGVALGSSGFRPGREGGDVLMRRASGRA